MDTPDADGWHDALPKVELHCHIERRAMRAACEARIAALEPDQSPD